MIPLKFLPALILGFAGILSEATAGETEKIVNIPQGVLSEKATSICERATLTGDWAGARNKLEEQGIHLFADYTGEYLQSVGGGNVFKANGHEGHGGAYNGLLDAEVTFNLEKLTGGSWNGASFGAGAYSLHGTDVGPRYVGSITNPSNIAGYDTVRLTELWFQQNLFSDRISIKVGQLFADTEFFYSDYGSLFMNSTFGAFPPIGLNYPNFSAYPVASPAVRLRIQATESLRFQAGAYSVSEGETGDKHSTHFPVDPNNDGVLSLYEAAYTAKPFGLGGTYKLGAIVHTNDTGFYTNFSSGKIRHGSFGLYQVIDQSLSKENTTDDQGLSFFARAYEASGKENTVDFYADFGVNYTGLFPGRDADVFGVAFGYTDLSRDFSDATVAGGGSALGNEGVLEVTYKTQITPWWYVQPDLQYILDPSAVKGSTDALVLGLRSGITF